MKNSKNNNIVQLLFIVAIICILLCIPLGILIGKNMYRNKDSGNIIYSNSAEVKQTIDNTTVNNQGINSNLLEKAETITEELSKHSISGNRLTWNLYKNNTLSNDEKTYIILHMLHYNGAFQDATFEEQGQCIFGYIEKSKVYDEFKNWFNGSASNIDIFPYQYKDNKFYFEGCGGFEASDYVVVYNYDYEQTNNYFYVYQAVGAVEFNGEISPLYNDVFMTKQMGNVTATTNVIIDESNYNDFSKYKLTFEISDDNLIFNSIIKIA